MAKQKTELGIDENLEGTLAYLFGFPSGIALYLLEPKNKFVRFHAMQSTLLFLGLFVAQFLLLFIPLIGWTAASTLSIVCIALWIVGMVKAYQHEKYKFPIVGDMAEQRA